MTGVDDAMDALLGGIDELKRSVAEALSVGVSQATLSSVVELSTVQASSLLEDFLEEIFYLSMLGEHPQVSAGSILQVHARTEVELLIFAEGSRREKYLDWLPMDRTQDRAKTYLIDGRPFDRVRYRSVEKRALAELTIIRNAVAHRGSYANERLLRLAAEKGYHVSRPADYLLSIRGGDPEVLLLLTQVELVGRALAAATDPTAEGFLQPEDPFTEAQIARPGLYLCVGCGRAADVSTEQKLGQCADCGITTTCPACHRSTKSGSRWQREIV